MNTLQETVKTTLKESLTDLNEAFGKQKTKKDSYFITSFSLSLVIIQFKNPIYGII